MRAKPELSNPRRTAGTAPPAPRARTTSQVVVAGTTAQVRAKCRPLLFVIHGPQLGSVFAVRGPQIVIGRGNHADVSLADDAISREHARLTIRGEGAYLEDLTSQGGTFINEVRVEGRIRLSDGDQLRLGPGTLVKFSMVDRLEEHAMLTLFEMTLRDPLTRVYNRRYFDKRLHEELSFARRQGTPLALLLIDIDHFKQVNDRCGHPVGDRVLELVAKRIQAVLRPEDVLARYGGEEFVVIARNTSLKNGEVLAERVRRDVLSMVVPLPGFDLRVTISIGVTALCADVGNASERELVAAVDGAMYRAKRAGRNRVYAAPWHDGCID